MDRNSSHPLTPAEAKARLRTVAQQATLANLISEHKWPVLAVATAAGFIAGRRRASMLAGTLLIRGFVPLLLNLLLHKPKDSKRHVPD